MRDVLRNFAYSSVRFLQETEGRRRQAEQTTRTANPEALLAPILAGQQSCQEAVAALAHHEVAEASYGPHKETLLLRFMGRFLGELSNLDWSDAAFEEEANCFLREIANPQWQFRALASLQGFDSDCDDIDFGDQVTACRTNYAWVQAEMDWEEREFEQWRVLAEPSPYQVLVRGSIRKNPENWCLIDMATPFEKARVLELALRLFKAGNVSVGIQFYANPSRYGLRGTARSIRGGDPFRIGRLFVLNRAELPAAQGLIASVRTWIANRREHLPQIALAQRYFTNTYEHRPFHNEDQIVDCFIALEALYMGENERQELAYNLASRISSLLAADDQERIRVFDRLRTFYNLRSKIVHGSQLTPKYQAELNNADELRGYVRSSIVAFMKLSERDNLGRDFYDRLQKCVLSGAERNDLRTLAGLMVANGA